MGRLDFHGTKNNGGGEEVISSCVRFAHLPFVHRKDVNLCVRERHSTAMMMAEPIPTRYPITCAAWRNGGRHYARLRDALVMVSERHQRMRCIWGCDVMYYIIAIITITRSTNYDSLARERERSRGPAWSETSNAAVKNYVTF